ncbi:hypothetical protein SLS62_004561 [Diatrype stigma]|uniref:Uncharacterized protein n=1 Tax=Diatrype stigma TaxID=117547 RepID=A0AAN9YQG0_9PEZI
MARRRRKDGRKPHSKSSKPFSKLMPFGFNFGEDGALLKHVRKTQVRFVIKCHTRSMDRGKIDEYLSEVVKGGVTMIDNVGKMPQNTFWHNVIYNVKWTGTLTGSNIFGLVVALVQAHEAFERNPPINFHPNAYSSTAKEIHKFSRLLKEKYAGDSEILDLYFSPRQGEGDEGSDTDQSIEFPKEAVTREEIETDDAWKNMYEDIVPEETSSEDEEEDEEEEDDEEYPNPYKPQPNRGLKYEKRVFAKYERDEGLDDEDERLLQEQQQMFAESRARRDAGATATSGDEMEVDSAEGASKPAEEAGAQNGGQTERAAAGKRARDDGGGDTEEALGAAPKRRRLPQGDEVGVEELTETMRDTGF